MEPARTGWSIFELGMTFVRPTGLLLRDSPRASSTPAADRARETAGRLLSVCRVARSRFGAGDQGGGSLNSTPSRLADLVFPRARAFGVSLMRDVTGRCPFFAMLSLLASARFPFAPGRLPSCLRNISSVYPIANDPEFSLRKLQPAQVLACSAQQNHSVIPARRA